MHSSKMRDDAPCRSSDLFGTNDGPEHYSCPTCTNAAPWTCGYAIAGAGFLVSAFVHPPSYVSAGLRNISIPMCLLEAPKLVFALTLFRNSPRMWGRLLDGNYGTRKD